MADKKDLQKPPALHDDDEEEVEIMPGVYMTDYSKHSRTKGGNKTVPDIPDDIINALKDGTLNIESLNLGGFTNQELHEQIAHLEQQVEDLRRIQARQHDIRHALAGMTPAQQLEVIRIKKQELQRSHDHLLYSQEKLLGYLQGDDKDPDIQEAYDENFAAIKTQKDRLAHYTVVENEILNQLGPHYRPIETVSNDHTTQNSGQNEEQASRTEAQGDAGEDQGMWV